MTSTPRLTNGHPPAAKPPGMKPRKAGKKAKKREAAEAVMAKAPPMPSPMPELAPMAVMAEPAAVEAVLTSLPMPQFPAFPLPSLDGAVDSLEQSYKAAEQGAQALSAKLFDMARANLMSGFDFMSSLASAKHPADIARLQMDYWDERAKVLIGQASDLRNLSAEIVAKANEPIRAHIKRSFAA